MATVGTPVRLSASFYDTAGNLANPTTVTVTVTDPSGAVTTPTAVYGGVGSYYLDYTPTLTGQYQFYFVATGANAQVTAPDVFTSNALATSALVSLAEVKQFEQLSNTTPAVDAQLLGFIRSATCIINEQCGYTTPTTFTETVTVGVNGVGRQVLLLSKTPVLSVQSVTARQIGVPAIDIASLNINPESGVIFLGNWFWWFGPQLVSYTAGRTVVPQELKDACLIIVGWMWETQRGGSVAVPGMGGEDVSVMMGSPGFPTRAFDLMRLANLYATPGLA